MQDPVPYDHKVEKSMTMISNQTQIKEGKIISQQVVTRCLFAAAECRASYSKAVSRYVTKP